MKNTKRSRFKETESSMPLLANFRISQEKQKNIPLKSKEDILHLPSPFKTSQNPWLSIKSRVLDPGNMLKYSSKTEENKEFFGIKVKRKENWVEHPLNYNTHRERIHTEKSNDFLHLSSSFSNETGIFKIHDILTLAVDKKDKERREFNKRIVKRTLNHDEKITKDIKEEEEYHPYYKKNLKEEMKSEIFNKQSVEESLEQIEKRSFLEDSFKHNLDQKILEEAINNLKIKRGLIREIRSKSSHINKLKINKRRGKYNEISEDEESFLLTGKEEKKLKERNSVVKFEETDKNKSELKRTQLRKRTKSKTIKSKEKVEVQRGVKMSQEEKSVFLSLPENKGKNLNLGDQDDYTMKIYSLDFMSDKEFLNLTYDIISDIQKCKDYVKYRSKSFDGFCQIFSPKIKTNSIFKKKSKSKLGFIDVEFSTQFDVLYMKEVINKVNILKKQFKRDWKKKLEEEKFKIEIPWYLNKKYLKEKIGILKSLIQNLALRKRIFGIRQTVSHSKN